MDNRYTTALSHSQELFSKAEALNPLAVLNRGFAYVMSKEKNVSSVKDVKMGDTLDITLKDGEIKAQVL